MSPAAIASTDGTLTIISLGIMCSTIFAVLSSFTSAYRDGRAGAWSTLRSSSVNCHAG